MNDKKNDFNLFDEWARGIMYRGGKEQEDFLSGYVSGLFIYGLVVFALFLIGVLTGN